MALAPWVRPVAYCEVDRYCQGVLLSRMSEGKLPVAPIWDDVRTLKGSYLPSSRVDIVYGGFPCQDISVAGHGKGLEGGRSGLFFEVIRLVEETNSPWVFLENVPAIRTRGLKEVIGAFTDLGYDCRWTCVSAAELGAPHLRKRWFLLAHSRSERSGNESGRRSGSSREKQTEPFNNGSKESLAYANKSGLEKLLEGQEKERKTAFGAPPWSIEPDVGRVANGIQFRVDRIKALGNAVVPLQAREAFKRLMGLGNRV